MLLIGFVLIAAVSSGYADEDCGSASEDTSSESRLLETLMCGYTKEQRPVKDHRTAVNVSVRFSLKYLVFDAQEEILTVDTWMSMSWVDEYLTWLPEEHDGLQELLIQSSRLWRPQLSLKNADINSYPSADFYTQCVANHTGGVTCVPHVGHEAICSTKLRHWPYDKQTCTILLGSWTHSGEQVNFFLADKSPLNREDFTPGPGWVLLDARAERTAGIQACCPNETFPTLRYILTLQRHAAGPSAVLVVPSIVIVVLTMSSLLLDVKDNTRLYLTCFSLFGHFTFVTEIGSTLPKHSSDTPIILLFVRDSMALTLVSLLLTLALSALRLRIAAPYGWVSKLNGVFGSAAKFAIFTEFEPALLVESCGAEAGTVAGAAAAALAQAEGEAAASREWATFSNILNTFTFVLLLIIYFLLFISYLPRP